MFIQNYRRLLAHSEAIIEITILEDPACKLAPNEL